MSSKRPDPEAVRQLIGRACLALDDADFDTFLDLCATECHYRIRVWSPELDKEMIWLEHDRDGLTTFWNFSGALSGMTTTVRIPSRRPTSATACAWLPDE